MKSDIDWLFNSRPKKAAELKAIVSVLTKTFSDIEMIILFGSYATGKSVEDVQRIDGNDFGYKSDFDLLVILHSNGQATNSLYTASIDQAIRELRLNTPVGAIYHGIDFVNRQISEGSYFFHEIIEQGYRLYNSHRHTLHPIKELDILELKDKAERDFENWYSSGNDSLRMYELAFTEGLYKEAVFNLHQATERYYAAIQLVFSGYKPKTHDLAELEVYVHNFDLRFAKVFLRENQEQENYFQLLRRAYVDARYNVKYTITKEDLAYIYTRIQILKTLTKEICGNKIRELAGKL